MCYDPDMKYTFPSTVLKITLSVAVVASAFAAGISLHANSKVYADVMRYDSGTYVLSSTLVIPDNTSLVGAGSGQTIFKAAPGFTGPMITTAGSLDPTTASVHHPNISIKGITVDGSNSAERGIYLSSVDNLSIVDVEAMNTTGNAIEQRGTQNTPFTEHQTWQNVHVHDCGGWGVYNGLRTRKVSYVDVTVDGCKNGMTIDHSEAQINGLQLTNNAADGLWIRNVFSVTANNIRATGNGRYGIHVQGLVQSTGSTWLAQNNKVDDIWFDGNAPQPAFNYGVTRETYLSSVEAGHSEFVTQNNSVAEQPLVIDQGVDVKLTGYNTTTNTPISN